MRNHTFKEADSYRVCFLVNQINLREIQKEYLDHLNISKDEVLILDLYKDPKKKKTSVSLMKEYLQEVEEVLKEFHIEYVVICNGDYFKTFTKEPKLEVHLGYVKEVDGYKVSYVPDYKGIFYDPDRTREKISRGLTAINNHLSGNYIDPGSFTFKEAYPKTSDELIRLLGDYLHCPSLCCDIETYSLKPHLAGLASIGFAKNQHEGLAFKIDPSKEERNEEFRAILKNFFEVYKGTLIFHNISFDAMVLIYQLWMDDITDTKGLLEGMKHILKNFEDTKIIAYLATNSCAGNELGLKALSQEFTGNYAQEEISDVSKIPDEQLLRYNLKDCLATWFVYDKYKPIMLQDEQEKTYKELFLPALRDIIQMQLTGFPLNMNRVLEVEQILQEDMDRALKVMQECPYTKYFVRALKEEWVEEKNKTLKKKRVSIEDAKIEFNPRSHKQLQEFLYDDLGLPVLNTTASGLPATDASTIESLKNHTKEPEILNLLQALIDFAAVDKILTAFIPAFKLAVYSPKTNWHYLIGNFNLGGTVSGRLSSSEPNLQNLPATGSKYAKIIKSCFQAPEGWLLCGLDFNALEAHIDALVTKDPAKLDVYIKDYDSHSYNAYHYWPDKHPGIELLNEDYTGKCFKCIINGHEHLLKGSDLINYDQRTITVEALFNTLSSKE